MNLSIDKLNTIISSRYLMPTKYYIYKKKYSIIETVSIKNGEIILIWIPDKYTFPYERNDRSDCEYYKLKKIFVGLNEKIVDKYGNQVDAKDFYPEVDIQEKNNEGDKHIEDYLIDNYNKPISIDSSVSNFTEVRDIYRQLSRLKYCVQYINYKLAIISDRFLCMTNVKDEIDCFMVKNFSESGPNNKKKLHVIISLEMLIGGDNNFEEDVKTIHSGVSRILDKNQVLHYNKLYELFDKKDDIVIDIRSIENIKSQGNQMLRKYENLVQVLNEKETEIVEKMKKLLSKDSNTFHTEMENKVIQRKLKEEYENITKRKDTVQEKIFQIHDHISDITLKADEILFDNIVLLKTITSNIEKLQQLFS